MKKFLAKINNEIWEILRKIRQAIYQKTRLQPLNQCQVNFSTTKWKNFRKNSLVCTMTDIDLISKVKWVKGKSKHWQEGQKLIYLSELSIILRTEWNMSNDSCKTWNPHLILLY